MVAVQRRSKARALMTSADCCKTLNDEDDKAIHEDDEQKCWRLPYAHVRTAQERASMRRRLESASIWILTIVMLAWVFEHWRKGASENPIRDFVNQGDKVRVWTFVLVKVVTDWLRTDRDKEGYFEHDHHFRLDSDGWRDCRREWQGEYHHQKLVWRSWLWVMKPCSMNRWSSTRKRSVDPTNAETMEFKNLTCQTGQGSYSWPRVSKSRGRCAWLLRTSKALTDKIMSMKQLRKSHSDPWRMGWKHRWETSDEHGYLSLSVTIKEQREHGDQKRNDDVVNEFRDRDWETLTGLVARRACEHPGWARKMVFLFSREACVCSWCLNVRITVVSWRPWRRSWHWNQGCWRQWRAWCSRQPATRSKHMKPAAKEVYPPSPPSPHTTHPGSNRWSLGIEVTLFGRVHAVDSHGCWRRSEASAERRFRGHWKHECLSVRMAVAAAMHHSSGKRVVATAEVAVQTERAPVTEHVAPDVTMPPPSSAIEYVAPAPGRARKKRHFELKLQWSIRWHPTRPSPMQRNLLWVDAWIQHMITPTQYQRQWLDTWIPHLFIS